jgi:hypothetical protein
MMRRPVNVTSNGKRSVAIAGTGRDGMKHVNQTVREGIR